MNTQNSSLLPCIHEALNDGEPVPGCPDCFKYVKAQLAEAQAKYNALLFAVASQWPGESRHETALRYIRQAEHGFARSVDALEAAVEALEKAERKPRP